MFGLTNQIRRCVVSVPSNLAEGVGRNTTKDTLQFLFIARGSLFELETQLFLSFD
jgi:four helix bundle protein